MKQILYKTFKIEPGESMSVLLLICQSFFLGIFYGSFDIAASALFLESFPSEMFPKAFVISGIAGIIITAVYTKLQSIISFARLAWINLFFITLTTIMLRIGYYYTEVKWLPFMLLVLLGPLNIVAMLGFWGVAGRVFSLRQAKRLFGLIDSGQVFGVIVSSYAIPFILVLNFSTKNILYICSFSVLMALIMQLVISSKFQLSGVMEGINNNIKKSSTGITGFLKNKFVLYMSAFVVLSMISAFFIYYSFLSVLNIKYPDSKELAKFLGLFTGTVMIFSFIFKTFVYSKIMQTYTLRISLLILPILLLLLSALAVVVGISFGYTAETSGFILFFLLIALCRLFSRSLKESIEAPSLKILYLSLDKNTRYDIQARIDGVVNEFAALFSGIILAGLGLLSFIQSIHYSIILIVILAAWIFIIFRLYKEYQHSLINSLSYNKTKQTDNNTDIDLIISENLNSSNTDVVASSLKILNEIRPMKFDIAVGNLLHSPYINIRNLGLDFISKKEIIHHSGKISRLLQNETDKKLKSKAQTVCEALIEKKLGLHSKESLLNLIKSKKESDREDAAKIISNAEDDIYHHFLISLLRDESYRVKTAAIKASAQIKLKEVCPLLIENLSDIQYSGFATEALTAMGSDALDSLELSFYKSDLDIAVQKRIIRIFGEIGGEKAIYYIVNKLNFPIREVAKFATIILNKSNYKYSDQHFLIIRQTIDLTISIIAWDIAAAFNAKEASISGDLRNALEFEINENYNQLYLLLSLMYDPVMISTVRDNIDNGSSEGVGYALELLDLYVSDDLKPILFPLFENTTIAEKVKRLQDFYPLEKQDKITLLNSIISRDINYISRWTKTCAIYNLRGIKNLKANNDLLAHLFNPDKLLFETTGFVVHQIDPEAYNNSCKRISPKLRNDLDYLLMLATEKKTHILYEKIIFLKSIPLFSNIGDQVLSEIAELMEEKKVDPGEILFTRSDTVNPTLYFIISGSVLLTSDGKPQKEFGSNTLLTEYLLHESFSESSGFIASVRTAVYFINRKNLLKLILNHETFSALLLKTSEFTL